MRQTSEIAWKHPDMYKKIVLRLGAFHACVASFPSLENASALQISITAVNTEGTTIVALDSTS